MAVLFYAAMMGVCAGGAIAWGRLLMDAMGDKEEAPPRVVFVRRRETKPTPETPRVKRTHPASR